MTTQANHPDPTAGERKCRYPCDCGQFHDEHCACMDGHAPAAPQTDGRRTEAEREAVNVAVDEAETCVCCGDDYGSTHVYEAVERIVAERVRVVEGERDAARAERDEMSGWIEEHALVKTLAQIAEWQEATGAELPAMARAAMHAYAARAESAEAAHRALRAEVEALAAEWDRYGPMAPEAHQILDDLRALLAGVR